MCMVVIMLLSVYQLDEHVERDSLTILLSDDVCEINDNIRKKEKKNSDRRYKDTRKGIQYLSIILRENIIMRKSIK